MDFNHYIGEEVIVKQLAARDDTIRGKLTAVIAAADAEDRVDMLVVSAQDGEHRIPTNELLQFFSKADFDNEDTRYCYVTFRYGKTERSKEHIYMSLDHSVKPGDKVLLWDDWLYVGNVIRAGFYTKKSAPYPVEKTWLIKEKVFDRIDFMQYDDAANRITSSNLYKDHCLNRDNDYKQYLARADTDYERLRNTSTELLKARQAFTKDAILSQTAYELDWDWCESNQIDVFYRTLWLVCYMAKHDCFDPFYMDKYVCLSLIYTHGDFDRFMPIADIEKPLIDQDMQVIEDYLAKRNRF